MPRILTTEEKNSLPRAARQTTLSITLSNNSQLNLSTAEVEINGVTYLGKLAPVDALNLENSLTTEGINLQITNNSWLLGQELINSSYMLTGARAFLGCYFRVIETGFEWHDVKMQGRIQFKPVNKDWVNIFFLSELDAAQYTGFTIFSAFPEPADLTEPMPPVLPSSGVNDIQNIPNYTPDVLDTKNFGRYPVIENSSEYYRRQDFFEE